MSVVGHQTPPIFKRGPTPLVRLVMYICVCLALMVADLKFRYLEILRQGLSVATYPLQVAAAAPVDFVRDATVYFATLVAVQKENRELRGSLLDAARRLLLFDQIEQENRHLKALLETSRNLATRSIAAEVVYDGSDPFTRKVIIDKGAQQGVLAGLAVVDEHGVLGQVTRVYPLQSEVTLLSDKDQAIPVMIQRNAIRGVVFGAGSGRLELRYVEGNADIQAGDKLVTSGLDGVFLAGLPVAKVLKVERDALGFAAVDCAPYAGVERSTQVLVLGRAPVAVVTPPAPQSAVAPLPPKKNAEAH